MKFISPLIVVSDLQISRNFYEKVLMQKVMLDLGENLCFESGFSLQVNYTGLVGIDNLKITYKSNDHELYFEEADFDQLEKHLEQFKDIEYLHKTKEYPWGQRVIRFYDPDYHIIEMGESMESVFKRFHDNGMSVEEVAKRTMHPVEYVKNYISD
ncbi:glyoxalase/bleomycin resistance/dioxygenase family protein [Mobilitalea sibirica]|uniref:Glyoxalase/bleomycin resistance/dioxygenase family protein n=1 Tax=Mobilitalea sibirica TaxID=1462919 RepID=A0A8J7L2H8_9FIRM|nr:glyoxalase/bleomycin resistance/dioxygenase family protein [Mobilitalea sibirica]MBH1940643.1 glyoxalase/bleomycin resistance/dioxygenase family protein [Mobilitalea sibirica]